MSDVVSDKEDILNHTDLEYEDVYIPEWDETIRIRELTGAERDKFEQEFIDAAQADTQVEFENDQGQSEVRSVHMENARARLVAKTAVDNDMNRLFDDSDIPQLAQISGRILDKLYDTAQRLSGITDEDIDELEENLNDSPNGDSGIA